LDHHPLCLFILVYRYNMLIKSLNFKKGKSFLPSLHCYVVKMLVQLELKIEEKDFYGTQTRHELKQTGLELDKLRSTLYLPMNLSRMVLHGSFFVAIDEQLMR
jgi:hypothetical protein